MNKNRTIFLTGATGLVGSYLLKLFLENGNKVYALARDKKDKNAKERVIDLLRFWDEDIDRDILKNLTVVEGDITYLNLGIESKEIMEELTSEVEIVFHSAALAELRVPLDIIRKINVQGTKNVVDFALECKQLKKVNHISTAYVMGTKNGVTFSEDMLELGQSFHNTYEQSKYEAEILVKDYLKKGLNISVFRPSMIIGDSKEGKITNFRTVYGPFHFFSQDIYEKFPVNRTCSQNLINIDTVAKTIFLLGGRKENEVYSITSPDNTKIGFLMNLASDYFRFKMPEFIPFEDFDFSQWTPIQKILAEPFIPYLNCIAKFPFKKTEKILNEYNFKYPKIDNANFIRTFEYCVRKGFIKRETTYIP